MLKNGIRRLRDDRGMSQEELAELLKTSRDYIGKLERGDKRLNMDWIERLSAILGAEPYELLIAEAPKPAEAPWSPSEETLAVLLRSAMPALLTDRDGEDVVQAAAHEIADQLIGFAANPQNEREPNVLRHAAETVARKLQRKSPNISTQDADTPDRKHHSSSST